MSNGSRKARNGATSGKDDTSRSQGSTATLPKYTGTLLPEHLAAINAIREHRMRIGLSTDRCNRPAAEAAVRLAYKTAGLAEPALMIWMDSPMGGAFAAAAIQEMFKTLPASRDQGQLRGQLWGQLRGQLGDQLRGQLGDQLWDQLGDQLGGQLRGQLWGQLGGQLGGQLWDQLGDQLRGQLGGQLWDQLGDQLDPWWEAYWLAFYKAGLQAVQLPVSNRLEAMIAATDELGWWWPMRGAVIMTDRPTALRMETAAGTTRLHCEDGPAIGYSDGYGLWSWHGTRVPQDLIEKGWDTSRILREENTEIRRCAIERMGWDQFVLAAGLKQVGEAIADPGNPGNAISLYDVPERIYGDVGVRVLLATNGTAERDGTVRRFGLTVPADIETALDAAGWGYGLTGGEYATAQRRT